MFSSMIQDLTKISHKLQPYKIRLSVSTNTAVDPVTASLPKLSATARSTVRTVPMRKRTFALRFHVLEMPFDAGMELVYRKIIAVLELVVALTVPTRMNSSVVLAMTST